MSVRGLACAGEHLGAATREAAGCDQGDGPGGQRGASQTGSAREGQRAAGRAGGQGTHKKIHFLLFASLNSSVNSCSLFILFITAPYYSLVKELKLILLL